MEKITGTNLQITNNIKTSISNNQNVSDLIRLIPLEKGSSRLAFRSFFFEIYLEFEFCYLGFNRLYLFRKPMNAI